MSSPGLELRWGYGFGYKPRKQEIFRPYVRSAIDFALEGMDEIGLPITERKYLWLEQRDPKEKWAGGATGKSCNVSVTPEEIRRRRIDIIWLAANILHELVHVVHGEYNHDYNMLDVAASEGIAYIAQYNFANELLFRHGRVGPPHRMVEKIRELPKRELNKMEAEFWKACAKPYSEEVFNDWFSRQPRPLRIARGVIVGVSAVSRQLEMGWEIPELVALPPHEVLDVA